MSSIDACSLTPAHLDRSRPAPRLRLALAAITVLGLALGAAAAPALGAPRPDLRVTEVSNPPATLTPGSSFTAADTTKNVGRARAPRSLTRYFLSADRKRGGGDRRAGRRPVKPLRRGAASRGSQRTLVVPALAAGSYYVLACADAKTRVRERNERNNCRASRRAARIQPWELDPVAPVDLVRPAAPAPTPPVDGSGGSTAGKSSTSSATTFGRSTVGKMHVLTADRKRASRFSLNQPGSVTQLSAYVDGLGDGKGASQSVRFLIYRDASGNPGQLLATTQSHTINRGDPGRWVHLGLTSPATLAAGDYHLGIHSSVLTRMGRYSAVDFSRGLRQNDDAFSDGATNPFGGVQSFNLGLSIYATYTVQPALDVQPPSAPQNVAFSSTSQSGLTMSWSGSSDNVGVAGYRVFRNNQLVASTQHTSHAHTGLDCGTSYTFAVEAFDAAGNTSTRTSASTSTQACPDPAPPSSAATFGRTSVGAMNVLTADRKRASRFSLTQAGTPSQISAYVDGHGDGTASSQTIRFLVYGDSSGSPGRLVAATFTHTINRGDAGRWVHLDVNHPSGLSAGTYHLGIHSGAGNRVGRYAAVTAAGALQQNDNSFADGATDPFGATQSFDLGLSIYATYTPGTSADTQAPSTPQNLAFSNKTATGLTMSWSASTDNVGVAGYRIYRDNQLVATTQQTSHNHTGLQCGTSYTWAVEALDAAGNTSSRTSATTSTQPCTDTTPPSQPGNLVRSGSTQTSVSLTWSASTDNMGVAGYRVYRDGSLAGSPSGTSHTVSGLECGKSYAFDVEAYDAAGNASSRATLTTATSACPEVTPPADTEPPSVPPNQRYKSITRTSVTLAWDAASDNVGVAGYHLYLNGNRVASTPELSYTYSGLTCGTSYTFALEAYDAAGNVSNRNYATGTRTTQECEAAPPSPTPAPTPTPEPTPDSTPPRDGLAHLWVDSNGGSCSRSASRVAYDDAKACGSAAAAYSAANASPEASLILVKGGTYGAFSIAGNRSSTNRITFDEAPGERAVFAGGWMRIGVFGQPSQAPKYVTVRNLETSRLGGAWENPENRYGLLIDVGAQHIRVEGAAFGGFLIRGAQDVQILNSESGPCRAQSEAGRVKTGAQPCELNKVDSYPAACPGMGGMCHPERIVLDGLDIHDFDHSPECIEQGKRGDGCHHRSMFINGVHGFTMRNSIVRDSVFAPWTSISGPGAASRGNHDLLFEHNTFGAPVFWQAGQYGTNSHGLQLAWCQNAAAGVTPYKHVTVRFNSFAKGAGIDAPGSSADGGGNCVLDNVRIYGNILGAKRTCGKANWSHNVFIGTNGTMCAGTGNIDLGGLSFPFYANDTAAPRTLTDFKLTGAQAAPDNRVPATLDCPPTDAFGTPRATNGTCDAGIHER